MKKIKLPKWSDYKSDEESNGRRQFRIGGVTFQVERERVERKTKRVLYSTLYYGKLWVIEIEGPNNINHKIAWPGLTDKKFKTREEAQSAVEQLVHCLISVTPYLVSYSVTPYIKETFPDHRTLYLPD